MENLIYLCYKIEPIFYKIVYMSIVASIIGVSILIIRKLLKKKISSKWISRIWIIFLISLIIPIQVKSSISVYSLFPINLQKIEEISVVRNNLLEKNNEVIEVSADLENKEDNIIVPNKSKENSFNIIVFLPLLWLSLILVSSLSCLITYISFELRIRKNILKNEEIENILNRSKEKLNINRKIKIVKQNIIKMPSIFGVFNVRILISDNILELSNTEIEYIFWHELSHYKRKDNILNILITILRCVYIFNPIVWLLLNQVKKDLELATDELAMENENNEIQKEYCKTLVKISMINSDRFLIQTMCLSDDKKNLERRIDNIKLIDKFKKKKGIIAILSCIIMLFLIIIFWAKSNNYVTLKDIIKLNSKYDNYTNAHCIVEKNTSYVYKENADEIQSIHSIENYFYKDNVIFIKSEINYEDNPNTFHTISYINYDENNAMEIRDFNDKNINIIDLSNVTQENRRKPIYKSFKEGGIEDWKDSSLKKIENKYLGKEVINNKETYKFELKYVTEYREENTIIWYNKETGLKEKEERKVTFVGNVEGTAIKEMYEILNYTYEFDVVKDEDIKKPNLEQYPDYTVFKQDYLVTTY